MPNAGEVEIVDAQLTNTGGGVWRADVTLRHDDTGWDHYADAWRVLDMEGNVLGTRTPESDLIPSMADALFNTFQIAEKTIANHKLRSHKPDIYIEPRIDDVKVLEFQKAEQIYAQAQPECERLEAELTELLASE